jgi:hypothetical protein
MDFPHQPPQWRNIQHRRQNPGNPSCTIGRGPRMDGPGLRKNSQVFGVNPPTFFWKKQSTCWWQFHIFCENSVLRCFSHIHGKYHGAVASERATFVSSFNWFVDQLVLSIFVKAYVPCGMRIPIDSQHPKATWTRGVGTSPCEDTSMNSLRNITYRRHRS